MAEETLEKDDEEFIDWECPECEFCECIAYHSVRRKENDVPEKWICVGRIIKTENPKDLHEALNEIRFCIANLETENETKQWEWTPYEALSVSLILQYGVRDVLKEKQIENIRKESQ